MTNEKTLTTTNKILVGNELIEEYLFDETKKPELEKGLKNLVNKLCEMIEDEDANLTTVYDGYGRTITLDTDTVYDMIDNMYLSLSWEAPRWGKATDRTYKCFAYEKERVILAYEVALKLGAYTDSLIFDLGTDDVKRIDFEDWYSLPDEQRKVIYKTDHEIIQADEIFIPDEIIEAEEVVKLSSVLEACKACKDYNFDVNDIADMLEVADGLFAYPEENGDGYILDAEDFKNDPDQHERQVEAGHKVIYDTMYLIAPYFKNFKL